ncbi:50S ribosomal protein L21 [Monoraphidium neglectum]|uniref:50S ribosomal protein L21 n=1 Tax=Monoraphidium neglectum TaxID=145388 RepID=A0A0D2LWZ4_9CHLO|nr:50S ribosomal protein L21 [Monoraphidium neglectum]KIY95979.1 50S ribosomal protein L21 [Monoraphidium neglectum]|eukprot:XP_013894999.1 50S ribosomal protein L21 [Monoraphidium neglectum]
MLAQRSAGLRRAFTASARPIVSRSIVRPVCQAAAVEKASTGSPSLLSAGAPDTYAIVEVGGRQMFLEPGKWYTCNRLQVLMGVRRRPGRALRRAPGGGALRPPRSLLVETGSKIRFGRVLALKQEGKFTVGAPYLEGAAVEAEVLEELKGPKVIVYKMRPKKHYRRKNGHRQPLSRFMVTKVGA